MTLADAATGTSAAGAITTVMLTIAITAALIGLYWLPTIIGWQRHISRLAQVAVINGLTGWTAIGWIVALAMAFEPARTTTKETA